MHRVIFRLMMVGIVGGVGCGGERGGGGGSAAEEPAVDLFARAEPSVYGFAQEEVPINRDALKGDSAKVRLNLSGNVSREVILQRSASPDGSETWESEDGSVAFSIDVKGAVSGAFRIDWMTFLAMPSGTLGSAQLTPLSSADECVVVEAPPEAGGSSQPLPALSSGPAAPLIALDTTALPINLMILYTPAAAAEAAFAGEDIEAVARSSIAYINTAFRNSLIPHEVREAYIGQINYVESPNEVNDLIRLQNPNDGFMDDVHPLRNLHEADIVTLLVADKDQPWGGVAYAMSRTYNLVGPQFAPYAFSVAKQEYGSRVVAHEVGHNLGCLHDRANSPSRIEGAFPYSYAHVLPNGASTIMYYTLDAFGIDHYSNPDVLYNGHPTGVDYQKSPASSADNARTIRNTGPIVAGFRGQVPLYIANDYLNDMVEDTLNNQPLLAAGGTTEVNSGVTWRVVPILEGGLGALPEGLTVSPLGNPSNLSGTPLQPGIYPFTLEATDYNAEGNPLNIARKDFKIRVLANTPQDLVIEAVYGDTNLVYVGAEGWQGKVAQQRAIVRNRLSQPSLPNVLRLYASTDATFGGDILIKEVDMAPLAAGERKRLSDVTFTLPSSWPPTRKAHIFFRVENDTEGFRSNAQVQRDFYNRVLPVGLTTCIFDVDGDGSVQVTTDVTAVLNYFKFGASRPPDGVNPWYDKWNSSMDVPTGRPPVENNKVDILDVVAVLDAFRGIGCR